MFRSPLRNTAAIVAVLMTTLTAQAGEPEKGAGQIERLLIQAQQV